ncbi:ABC transporter substrate-binding protein [Cryobacterium glaciale]|uniref:ABC transporter substrate-binding protein n=1 Tax=Cryobacterium glaciale TaxID=1259145 RepID=UPI001F54003C|nr:ABC transporter substrate-binding protein [Cryobacterium glaciale]
MHESIESDDATTWTVTLNDDWTFTNDEPVTASSFVDAWNYGALVTNAQGSSGLFNNIVGYSDVANTKDDPTGATDDSGAALQIPDPLAETMSGLTVVDDTTFTVQLSGAEADWPLRLGYSAYSPLPTVAFDDMDAFGENPIGNGPYELAGDPAARGRLAGGLPLAVQLPRAAVPDRWTDSHSAHRVADRAGPDLPVHHARPRGRAAGRR